MEYNYFNNNLIAYADDATLFAKIPSPADRVRINNSLNSDLAAIVDWCRIWGMKLNPNKTQAIFFSRSRTVNPPHPPLVVDGQILKLNDSMKILGITLDSKLTFEKHITNITSTLSRLIGLLRKSLKIFNSQDIAIKCFFTFLLPIFEYCSPVWSSAADCHLALLDRVLRQVKILIPSLKIDLKHRRSVASLCMFYKIFSNDFHPVRLLLPGPYVPTRMTRHNSLLNSKALRPTKCESSQFQRSFIPSCISTWNLLPEEVVNGPIHKFKTGVNKFLLNNKSS